MKGKKFQKYANIHQQFKPVPSQPLKKLHGVKPPNFQTGKEMPYMQLEKVIGLSSRNNNSIAVNPVNGDIAYPAGSIICIYSPKENKQHKFLFSRSQRSFSCVTYAHTGRYFAAGEGAFRQPEITIWEVQLDGQYVEIKHLKGHKYGIESLMFSPNLQYLISLGDANDRGLFVWDWESEQRVTSNKLGKPVHTFAFSENGQFFVTAGYLHLKYWQFDENGKVQKTETNSRESIMESKSADLSKVKVKIFAGVGCRHGQVFALAVDGHLYVYDKNRKLTKWMNIKVERALSFIITNDYLFCGCSDGVVRLFSTKSLEHILTLPKPPPLGQANIESGVKQVRIPTSKDSKFADAMAVVVDEVNQRIVVVYSDKMIFIWDIKQLDKISVYRTSLSHSGPIHDIQYIPNSMDVGYPNEHSAMQLSEEEALTKFMTCASDRTIRFWQFIDPTSNMQTQQQIYRSLAKNAYCKDMSRMIYVNSENRDTSVGQFDHFKIRPMKLNDDGSMLDQATLSPDDKDLEQQIRCVRISPDGKHVACGDWTGNIRIHDTKSFEEIQCIPAHESEVLCLDYSPIIELSSGNNSSSQQDQPQSQMTTANQSMKYWLASGSRDRLAQIYEVTDAYSRYDNVAILEDHSSTLTTLKFAEEHSVKGQRRLKLISCGADKQIVLRNVDLQVVQQNDWRKLQNMQTEDFVVVHKKEQCKYKTFSMDIAHQAGYIATGHDKILQLWQLSGCEKVWEKRPESSRKSGSMDQIKVIVDQNAGVVISSSTDKYVTIYEAATGNVICRTTCGEVTTALCLSTNLKHLITTSTDGIIYIWRLPDQLSKALQKLKQEQKQKELELPQSADESVVEDKQRSQENQPQPHSQQQQPSKHQQSPSVDPTQDDEFNELEQISQMPGVGETGGMPGRKKEEQQQQPVRISEIMAQISKVTGQIEKIQPRGKPQDSNQSKLEEQPEEEDEEEFDFSGSVADQDKNDSQNQELAEEKSLGESVGNLSNRKRNAWANKRTQETTNSDQNQENESSENKHQDATIRPLKVKENKLPRWAQSVTGDQLNDVAASRMSKYEEEKKHQMDKLKNQILQQLDEPEDTAANENQDGSEDIEEIFSNTLDKAQKEQPQLQQKHSSHSSQGHPQSAVTKNTFYERIEEDLDEDKKSDKSQEEDDEEEKLIKEQLKRRQMYRSRVLLGLDDDDDDNEVNKSNNRFARLRQNENRTSLSQQFFQRKMGASSEQNLFKGVLQGGQQQQNDLAQARDQYIKQQQQQQQKEQQMKVEDLFVDEPKSNQPTGKPLQSSQSEYIHQNPQVLKPNLAHPQSQQNLSTASAVVDNKKPTFTILSGGGSSSHQKNHSSVPSNSRRVDIDMDTVQPQQKPQLDIKKVAEDKQKQIEDEQAISNQAAKQAQRPQINILEDDNEEQKQSQILHRSSDDQVKEDDNLQVRDITEQRRVGGSRSNSRQGERYKPNNEEDESIVQINSVQSQQQQQQVSKVDEAAVNAVIKTEMDKINNSLAKITQCLNSTGQQHVSFNSAIRVKDEVTESLNRSMGLWNSMMMSLSNRTSLNVNLLQQSQQMSSVNMSQSYMGSASGVNQSFISSQISIKEDARDLLQKYSDLLVEEISKKMMSQQKK